MATDIDLSRPEPAQSRTELTLVRIASSWRLSARGAAFVTALVDFLRSQSSPATARVYSYSVLELFEYFEQSGRALPLPDEVTRADAARYASWLASRELGLRRFRLTQDRERALDVAIWDIVAAQPGCPAGHIRARLLQDPKWVTYADAPQGRRPVLKVDLQWRREGGLSKHLACLVLNHTLTRRPTVEELRRRGVVDVGGETEEAVFRYWLPSPVTAPGPERASGMVTRLTALSAFWSRLCAGGENAPGAREPLLRYNVWREQLERARAAAPSHQEARRQLTTPDMELFIRLLSTTYERTHGQYAVEAARLAAYSRPVPRGHGRPSLADLRDRALLLLLLQPGGPRAQEVARMRRGDVRGDPRSTDPRLRPQLTITGKGGRRRVVPVPYGALDALQQLTKRLQELATDQWRYRGASRAEQLLRPEAPLLPAIRHWGANAGVPSLKPLGRSGLAMALRRRAERAGIDPGSDALRRVHPHGFRRLFANVALRGGTPLNVVQAMMGHASGTTTLRYAEEKAPERLVAEPFRGVSAVEQPPAPLPPPPRAAPKPPAVAATPKAPTKVAAKPEPKRPKLPKPRQEPSEVPLSPAPVEILEEIIERPEPEAPPEAQLVAVGKAPERAASAGEVRYWQDRLRRVLGPVERQQLSECAARPSAAEERLCGTYRLAWGERGDRHRLALVAGEREELGAELAALEAEAELLGIEAPEAVEADLGSTARLEHAYAGEASGLVWWAGPAGQLKPELPVPSPAQLGSCAEGEQESLCEALAELWRRWMLSDERDPSTPGAEARGPTSACALVGWVGEAIATSEAIGAVLRARGGSWLGADAAWELTSESELDAREHGLEALTSWFERVAWQFRPSPGRVAEGGLLGSYRAPKVIGKLPEIPSYYAEEDPLASLDRPDRFEVLDLVAALSGRRVLGDRTRRFGGGTSRHDLSRVIEAMRRYDEQIAVVGDVKARREAGEAAERDVARAEEAAAGAAAEADRLIAAVGGGRDFSLADVVAERVKQRRGAGKREYRGDFYLRVVGALFGEEAASDPLLTVVAEKKKPALGRYRELLKPDYAVGTIVHHPDYAKRFAEQTGAHSECVARRTARDLWELWRSGSAKFKRRKDLIDLVDAMAAYRVPCPMVQEQQLRGWLGAREPLAIYEQFREAHQAEELAEEERGREREILAEVFSPMEEEFAESREAELRYLKNERARPNRYRREVAELLPTPLECRVACLTAR